MANSSEPAKKTAPTPSDGGARVKFTRELLEKLYPGATILDEPGVAFIIGMPHPCPPAREPDKPGE